VSRVHPLISSARLAAAAPPSLPAITSRHKPPSRRCLLRTGVNEHYRFRGFEGVLFAAAANAPFTCHQHPPLLAQAGSTRRCSGRAGCRQVGREASQMNYVCGFLNNSFVLSLVFLIDGSLAGLLVKSNGKESDPRKLEQRTKQIQYGECIAIALQQRLFTHCRRAKHHRLHVHDAVLHAVLSARSRVRPLAPACHLTSWGLPTHILSAAQSFGASKRLIFMASEFFPVCLIEATG
jgi:hypothetical protein